MRFRRGCYWTAALCSPRYGQVPWTCVGQVVGSAEQQPLLFAAVNAVWERNIVPLLSCVSGYSPAAWADCNAVLSPLACQASSVWVDFLSFVARCELPHAPSRSLFLVA